MLMQNKKLRLISVLSTMALTFVLSGGLTLPGSTPENPDPVFRQTPVEENTSDTDTEEGIQPLSDLDETVTMEKI